LLDPDAFDRCFLLWVNSVRKNIKGEIIALDGKTLRRSHKSGERALHLVNAFAAENSIVLGQRKVDGKSNEITAIPELLKLLSLRGCIVTADAMGTQCWIAKKIKEHKADYVLAVKGNQERLHQDLQKMFAVDAPPYDHAETSEKSHGRVEVRTCTVSGDLSQVRDTDRWDELQSVAAVTCSRTLGGITSSETRYFISSLKPDAKEMLRAVRAHWTVENNLHWSLDVSFREDESRVRIGHAGQNLALVRKLALNLLRKETTAKVGLKAKQLKAGWSEKYLGVVLGI
jgi:predicted transposase YbfD/YdcC